MNNRAHVRAVSESFLRHVDDRIDVLGCGQRLTSQHTFVALEFRDVTQTHVRWHDCSDAKFHNVAWHET